MASVQQAGTAGPAEPAFELPVEQPGHSWWSAPAKTLAQVVAHPFRSFAVVREPVRHGRVLGFLLAWRLPFWCLLVAILAGRQFAADGPEPTSLLPIHGLIEPPMAEVLSAWLMLMIPVGLPFLYFFVGLMAHLGVTLTGGASRSIGASMRAMGYAMAPALVLVGVADIPAYLGLVPGRIYLGVLGGAGVWTLWQAGGALARTHRVSVFRGLIVGVLPVGLFVALTAMRVALVLSELPGLPPPSSSPYYIP